MADVSSTIDGLFFGYVIGLILLGIIIVQTWNYSYNNDDGWVLRTFVAGLVVLGLSETICTTWLVHHYLISKFGDIEVLTSHSSLISVDFTVSNVTYFIVHLFFARRLWKLRSSWLLPGVIAFTSTTMLALGISVVAEQNLGHLIFSDYERHYIMIQIAALHALAIATDILITIGLCWTLSTAQADFKRTQSVVQRLLIFILTRGILVCLTQLGHIVMYFMRSTNTLFWISLHLDLGKIYIITTLATLNSRNSLRERLEGINIHSSFFNFGTLNSSQTDSDVENTRQSRDPKQDGQADHV